MMALPGQPLNLDPSAAPLEAGGPLGEDPDPGHAVRGRVLLDPAHQELAGSPAAETRAYERPAEPEGSITARGDIVNGAARPSR